MFDKGKIKTIILISLLIICVGGMLGLIGTCNKKDDAANYNPAKDTLRDSLVIVNYELKKLREQVQDNYSKIMELKRMDSIRGVAFRANRVSDERLKVKQTGIRKQVENLTKDSLRELINNYE